MPKIDIYTDGASRGNPGPAACGFAVYADGVEIFTGRKYLGTATNNFAEYTAVIEAAKCPMVADAHEINFFMDSELIVKQMTGIYRVKHPDMIMLKQQLDSILAGKKVTFTHVRRELNKTADRLANEAIDEAQK
ncbi:ribonuclease HI family protein [Seleniivibrio woodruffii]|uniref:ribonuclease HI family protein n=1 Tax=Seleniivibrio woodruffii TaxID=1078050 RepID=UPI0024097E7B|nr:ribonuclease HI family protein [Seleniivibrio woodruffii]